MSDDATGVPSGGSVDHPGDEPVGRPSMRHWRQSTITEPGLDDRGGVFFAAIEMTRMPMVLTDPNQPDNPIVFANNAFLDLTGYELPEILGRNCRFLQGPDTSRETVGELRDAVARRTAVSVEMLNYRRNGSPFWNAVFIGPVFDPDGKLLYFFASQLDVSRRREGEQALRQAQKMESIGQLTAGLAHDFNNLLHVISASLERLAARPDDPAAAQRYLAAASQAAERGAKLTRQLLAFARRSRLEPKAVNLSDLISSFGELLDATVGSRTELRLDLRRRLPDVRLDPVHLEMALLNLVINARDALGGEGEITVETRPVRLDGDAEARHLPPGDYVALTVSDDGPGMPPAVRARAAEPFFTTKPAGQGTGLGLAMAQGFAQQSGGRLEIDSEPGAGARIRMLFPVAVEAPSESPAPRPAPAEAASPAGRVLVVDDEPAIAQLAAETLSEQGYGVTLAHSAEEAVQRLRDAPEPFALVFTDVVMPGGLNGLALADRVAELSPDTPVLMTTGYNDELAIRHEPRRQTVDVIGKPYRRSELLDRVAAAIRGGPRRGPGRDTSDFGVAEA